MLKHFGEFFAAVVAFLIAFWQWLVAVWAFESFFAFRYPFGHIPFLFLQDSL
jgi:hypothetical protein